jgi:Cu(I)/Ag(I) efflux system membrane fusion protein
MQPDVIKDAPGTCDVCGTPLVSAESLNLASVGDENLPPPLVIPVSAPLITGKRAVVYVAVSGKKGIYEGREVTLGPRSGDYFIVKSGLGEGEDVVTNGNFKIDSSFQILAKSSMMSQSHDDDSGNVPIPEGQDESLR